MLGGLTGPVVAQVLDEGNGRLLLLDSLEQAFGFVGVIGKTDAVGIAAS